MRFTKARQLTIIAALAFFAFGNIASAQLMPPGMTVTSQLKDYCCTADECCTGCTEKQYERDTCAATLKEKECLPDQVTRACSASAKQLFCCQTDQCCTKCVLASGTSCDASLKPKFCTQSETAAACADVTGFYCCPKDVACGPECQLAPGTSGDTAGCPPSLPSPKVCSSGQIAAKPATPAATGAGAATTAKPIKVPDFLGGATLNQFIGRLGSVMTGIVGTIAFAMFVWGGFLILTARGNSAQVGKAKQIFVWTVVGLVVVFGSQAILTALFNILSQGSI